MLYVVLRNMGCDMWKIQAVTGTESEAQSKYKALRLKGVPSHELRIEKRVVEGS